MTGAAADPERVAFGWPGCPGWSTGTLGVGAVTAGSACSSPVQPATSRAIASAVRAPSSRRDRGGVAGVRLVTASL